jgi:hypothetical protein
MAFTVQLVEKVSIRIWQSECGSRNLRLWFAGLRKGKDFVIEEWGNLSLDLCFPSSGSQVADQGVMVVPVSGLPLMML